MALLTFPRTDLARFTNAFEYKRVGTKVFELLNALLGLIQRYDVVSDVDDAASRVIVLMTSGLVDVDTHDGHVDVVLPPLDATAQAQTTIAIDGPNGVTLHAAESTSGVKGTAGATYQMDPFVGDRLRSFYPNPSKALWDTPS